MENHGSRILIQRGSRCGLINGVHLLLLCFVVPKKVIILLLCPAGNIVTVGVVTKLVPDLEKGLKTAVKRLFVNHTLSIKR